VSQSKTSEAAPWTASTFKHRDDRIVPGVYVVRPDRYLTVAANPSFVDTDGSVIDCVLPLHPISPAIEAAA
jgi:hypothetical protein